MLIRVKGKARRFVRRPAGTPYPHRRVQTAAEDGQGQHNETETTESNNTGSHTGKTERWGWAGVGEASSSPELVTGTPHPHREREQPGSLPVAAQDTLPHLLRRAVVREAEKVKQVARTAPGVTVPMRVSAAEDLEAGAHITAIVMLFEGAATDAAPI